MTQDVGTAWIVKRFQWDASFGKFPPQLRCRRCDEIVGWMTKHVAERHGEQITPYASDGADPLLLHLW